MGMEELGTLNLADADTSGGDFEPIPASTYLVHVHEVKLVEIAEDSNGKLPPGTPGFNIQVRVDDGKFTNRVLFKRYYLPPVGYDAEKRKKSLGMFVNFLVAIGYDKADVMSGNYDNDPTDWVGRQARVSVRIRAAQKDEDGNELYPAQNEITGFKPVGDAGAALGANSGVL